MGRWVKVNGKWVQGEEQQPVAVEEPVAPEPQPDPVVEADPQPEPVVAEPVQQEPANNSDEKEASSDEDDSSGIVVRRDVRNLSDEDYNRFVGALKKLMEPKPDDSTASIYKDIAEIHGKYCAHGQEHFPGWHRAYLVYLEKALQKADVQLGNDGNISLPYWDWTDQSRDDYIPRRIFRDFSAWPDDFPLKVEINRKSEDEIRQNLVNTPQQVQACLNAKEHWKHASSRWIGWGGPSVEIPHNRVHVAVGYPMGSVEFASFDPIFYLHHCNVDRIYEAYLGYEKDSRDEFKLMQQSLEQEGEDNRFREPLIPFKLDKSDEDFRIDHTFSTKPIGYTYDTLPIREPQQLREAPTVAHFADINIMEMEGKTYQLHVFVKDKSDDEFKVPDEVGLYSQDLHYAGMGAVFGRGVGCAACEQRPSYHVFVELTKALRNLGISRYDAELKVMCVVTTDPALPVVPIEDTPVPRPVIVGPSFEDRNENLSQDERNQQRGEEVMNLQQYLQRFGHYGGPLDGDYGPNTEAAVLSYQKLSGNLKQDGLAGPNTKGFLLTPRCYNPDVGEEESKAEKQEISYFVGAQPGKLNRDQTLQEIQQAFDVWANVCGLSFTLTDERAAADITVSWSLEWAGDKNRLFPFDGKGLTLARGTPTYVNFDRAETWKLQGEDAGDDDYYILPVAVHEIGHTLGLLHSDDPESIMAPFYNPAKLGLTENDIATIQGKYGV